MRHVECMNLIGRALPPLCSHNIMWPAVWYITASRMVEHEEINLCIQYTESTAAVHVK